MNDIDMRTELFIDRHWLRAPRPDYGRKEEMSIRAGLSPLQTAETRVSKILDLVMIYEHRGDADGGINILEEYLGDPTLASQRANILFRLGQMNEQREDFDRAAACYQESLDLESRRGDTLPEAPQPPPGAASRAEG